MQRLCMFPTFLGRVESKRMLKKMRRHENKFKIPDDAIMCDTSAFQLHPVEDVHEKRTTTGYVKSLGPLPDLPFKLERTSKADNLPVYSDYKNGRTRILTLVRKFYGDSEALAREISAACDGAPVFVRNGRIEVKEVHAERLCANAAMMLHIIHTAHNKRMEAQA